MTNVESPITLDTLVDGVQQLPTPPGVVNEITHALSGEGTNVEALARSVGNDAALLSQILRIANSPFYGMRTPVSTAHEAILILGFRAVHGLVSTAALMDYFKNKPLNGFNYASFWAHSLGVAVCCRVLAGKTGLNPDIAFSAGILHDIGKLLLAIKHPKPYEEMLAWRDQNDAFSCVAERRILGVTHAQAGAVLAQHWHFSSEIQHAIAGHHGAKPLGTEPTENRAQAPTPENKPNYADLVHVADILVHGLDLAQDTSVAVYPLIAPALYRLGLTLPHIATLFPQIQAAYEAYSGILSANDQAKP